MTPEQAKLRARKAAYSLHARYDAREITSGARAAFLRRFEREVDPHLTLTVEERRRRGRYALKAHMTGLALASARARAAGKVTAFDAAASRTPTQSVGRATAPKKGTTEATHPGRSDEGAADDGGRPLQTA